MRGSVIQELVKKDWRLHLSLILPCVAAGLFALGILQIGGEVRFVIGAVWFFVSIIVGASMLPISAVVNERKKQTLAFVMSLPVSSIQYTTAKLISTISMFLVPWLTLVAAAIMLVEGRHILPQGAIPLTLILCLLPLVGFSVITGCALVGESEGWAIAGTVVCNSSYGLVWYLFSRVPSIIDNVKSPVAVWNQTALLLVSGELLSILLIFGVTFYLQSRKRDFI
jgi:hypothetical protein